MNRTIAQLQTVARISRLLLLTQRLLQAASVLLIIALISGVSDYLLRLPGMVRLVSDILVIVLGSIWLGTRLIYVSKFSPSLTDLALRVEVLYPHLQHKFASAIDFLVHQPESTHSSAMRRLEDLSLDRVEEQMSDVKLKRLLNPTQTGRYACLLGLMLVVMLLIASTSPQSFSLAMQRWVNPLGDAQWPRRVETVSLNSQLVWPSDSPLPMQLAVERGYHTNMRAWLNYRFVWPDRKRSWQSVLMSQQGQSDDKTARFERLIDLDEQLMATDLPAKIEFYYQAGDGQTRLQTIDIVARPSVTQVELHVTPPAYAVGLIREQSTTWNITEALSATLRSARVLTGSTVQMKLLLNKPVMAASAGQILPGLIDAPDAMVTVDEQSPNHLTLKWTLSRTVQSQVQVTDDHGLSNISDQQYRIEAIADQLPSVRLTEPAADVFVLPTATLPVIASSRDDVSLERLSVTSQLKADDSKPVILDQQTGRQSELTVKTSLNIKSLGGVPGDVFELVAIAQDSFSLNSQTHDPVRTSPRLITVIDEEKFTQQIRSELGVVRQMALRLSAEQQLLEKAPAQSAKPRQKRVTDQLGQHQKTIDRIKQRMSENALKSEALEQIVDRAAMLLDQAKNASADAVEKLDQPQRQASAQQQKRVSKNLTDLVELLDQGRDALTLQLQLQQMQTQQEDLQAKARKLLPNTAGKTAEQLDEKTRKEVDELAQQQQALSEQAKALINRMRQTAERLGQQEQAQDQASAQSLAQAASTAQQQGLSQSMQKASESASQNQMSQTMQKQQESLETMKQMREQMAQQSKRKQAILKRQMAELAEMLKQLITRQQQQVDQLAKVNDLITLVEPQVVLRQNTISVQDQAMGNPQTQQVGQTIDQAVSQQADAVGQLRQQDATNARTHEVQAIAHLKNALTAIEEAQQKAEQDQQQEDRDELQKAYEELAQQENQLAAKVKPFAELETINRRHRRDLGGLAGEQNQLRDKINALKEKVEQTTLFLMLHEQIDEQSQQIATDLRQGQQLKAANRNQKSIESRLRQMAKVLQMQSEQEKFSDAQAGDQSGGGGGGGQQQSAGVVPPIAELRLLREIQIDVHEQTRIAQQENAPASRIVNLSQMQRELADMGQKLIDKFMQNQQAQPVVEQPKVEGDAE
ncbi:MAG TPA: hypothetical protein DCM28_10195 [Phycisphaerales bacterium]|nr:hypothetical protein [Phycisphaerales bacterium]HCD33853.1 hypothetical protein [Phycisphaerales bacterium]|tara:strand:+ start:68956 stop:72408 length:3453 start_codon:yes stop_codon:yes gene_type:complete